MLTKCRINTLFMYLPNGIMYLEDQICITYRLLMIGGQ